MFSDLDALYEIGLAMQRGEYTGLYPLPFAWLMALIAYLPLPVVRAGVFVLSACILVSLFRRRALLWATYTPILISFALGQPTMLWLALLRRRCWWAWLALSLKPHWLLFALPQVVKAQPGERKRLVVGAAALYGLALLVRPSWPAEWARAVLAEGRVSDATSSSLWAAPLLVFVAGALLMLMRRARWLAVATVLNPAMRAYDYAVLAPASGGRGPALAHCKRGLAAPDAALWLIPLSWAVTLLSHALGAAWVYAALGLWVGLRF